MAVVANEGGRVPIYQKLRDKLAREIKSGDIKTGERLPSERALAAQMGAARQTVREALFMLEGEGLINRRKNRGWYVDATRARYDPTHHMGTFKMIRHWGGNPSSIGFGWQETKASLSIAKMMDCEPATELLFHRAIILWNDRKISYEENYLLKSYFPEFSATNFEHPISDFLQSQFNVSTTQVGFRARPTPLYGVVSTGLDVTPGTPGIYLTRIKACENKIMQVDRDYWISGTLEIVIGQFPPQAILAQDGLD